MAADAARPRGHPLGTLGRCASRSARTTPVSTSRRPWPVTWPKPGMQVSDLGTDSPTVPVDYPLFGIAVGRAVAEGRADRGSASAGRASASASRPTRSRASGPPWSTT